MTDKITPIVSKGELRFGALIKKCRKQARLSQRKLAELLGVTTNTVQNWERDMTKPDHKLIPALCGILGLRLHELYQTREDEKTLSYLESRVIGDFRQLDDTDQHIIEKMIRVMIDERNLAQDQRILDTYQMFRIDPGTCAAGSGDDVPDCPPEYIYLRKNGYNEKADAIVKVSGRSMEPVYWDGDMVYIRVCEEVLSGMDAVVDTDQGTIIKRISEDGRFVSVNPEYPYHGINENSEWRIRGRVLGVVQPSDQPDDRDLGLIEELFHDEILEFKKKYYPEDWR